MTLAIPGPTGRPSTVKGTGMKALTMQQFTPEQLDLFKSLFGQLGPGSYLSKLAGGAPEMFDQLEAPALKQFAGIQGNLASRFSGMGTGARHSSGFYNTMNTAAQDFASQLQSQRLDYQRNAMRDLFEMAGLLMGQRPYETSLIAKKQPFWKELILGAAPGAAQGASQGLVSKWAVGSGKSAMPGG